MLAATQRAASETMPQRGFSETMPRGLGCRICSSGVLLRLALAASAMLLASASWGSAGFAAEDLSKGLIEEHEAVNYDHCMSLKQLDEVLQVAAWKNPAAAQDTGATMERAVVLTSCK
eukprot:366099-Chlamydomonas_euryale.AAC.3